MKYKMSTDSGRSAPPIKHHLFLIGFMGAGKTTVGKSLSERLACEFHDSDEWIVEKTGQSIPEIFAAVAEEGFRDIETVVLKELCGLPPAVIALGGGAVMRAHNRTLLAENGLTYYLKWQPEQLLERIFHDSNRPLVAGRSEEKRKVELLELFEQRRKIYDTADHIIDCHGGPRPEEIVEQIEIIFRRSFS